MLLGVAAAVSEWQWWWRVIELSDLQLTLHPEECLCSCEKYAISVAPEAALPDQAVSG